MFMGRKQMQAMADLGFDLQCPDAGYGKSRF
jgi:hypothetical protein